MRPSLATKDPALKGMGTNTVLLKYMLCLRHIATMCTCLPSLPLEERLFLTPVT